MVQVAVRDVTHMEEVIDSMMPYVATNTSMILASPVPWNSILPAVYMGKNRQSRKNALLPRYSATVAGLAGEAWIKRFEVVPFAARFHLSHLDSLRHRGGEGLYSTQVNLSRAQER